jgi:hypothetical protein
VRVWLPERSGVAFDVCAGGVVAAHDVERSAGHRGIHGAARGRHGARHVRRHRRHGLRESIIITSSLSSAFG